MNTDHNMLPVQVGRGPEGNKELGPIGVGPGIGHGEHAGLIVLEHEGLVGKAPPPDGLTTRPVSLGEVAALHHEALDHAVEGKAVVEPVGGELAEVFNRLRCVLIKELDRDRSGGGVERGF